MEQIINAAAQFAKLNKISKQKVELFAKEIVAMMPKPEVKIIRQTAGGRPFSANTLEIRSQVKQMFEQQMHKQGVTAKQLADTFNAKPIEINNALIWLEQQGKAHKIGHHKIAGQRGKPSTIWHNQPAEAKQPDSASHMSHTVENDCQVN